MTSGQRIRNLEEAVLLLSKALNKLIQAHEEELPGRQYDEGRVASRPSDRLVNEAHRALEAAVDLVSLEEHEQR